MSVHRMSPPQQMRQRTSNFSSLLIYRPQKDERLSWPSWLTYIAGGLPTPYKWSPISYKSSAGRQKHIGQRPMLYRWTTQPTIYRVAGHFVCLDGRYEMSCWKSLQQRRHCPSSHVHWRHTSSEIISWYSDLMSPLTPCSDVSYLGHFNNHLTELNWVNRKSSPHWFLNKSYKTLPIKAVSLWDLNIMHVASHRRIIFWSITEYSTD